MDLAINGHPKPARGRSYPPLTEPRVFEPLPQKHVRGGVVDVNNSAYGRRIRTEPRALPVVELRTESCRCGMMRIHHPIFKVIGWTYPEAGNAGEDAPPPNADTPLLKTV
jgi:hypothetical protein